MKKFLSLIAVFVLSLGIFVGCGYAGGSNVTGIAFTSSHFYVDYNVNTALSYKIYPSTADAFDPQITFIGNEIVQSKIVRVGNTNVVKVIDESFESIDVSIKYSTGTGKSYVDTCTVELKKYPASISVKEDELKISNKGILQIPYYGDFAGVEKVMDTSYYKTKVKSSDNTVITVEDHNNVVVKSTGKQGRATITIEVCASDGSAIGDGLETEVDVVVTNNVHDCAMLATHTDNLGNSVAKIYRNLKANETSIAFNTNALNNTYTIEPILLDKEGYIVEDVGVTVVSLDESIMSVTDNNDGTFSLTALKSGHVKLLITSKGYGPKGEIIIFDVNFIISISS